MKLLPIPMSWLQPILISVGIAAAGLILALLLSRRRKASLGEIEAIVIDPGKRAIYTTELWHVGGSLYTDGRFIAIIPEDSETFTVYSCIGKKCFDKPAYLLVKAGRVFASVKPDDVKYLLVDSGGEESLSDVASLLVKLANRNVITKEFKVTPTLSLALQVPTRNAVFELARSVASYVDASIRSMSAVTGSLAKLYETLKRLAEAEAIKAEAFLTRRMWWVLIAVAISVGIFLILGVLKTP